MTKTAVEALPELTVVVDIEKAGNKALDIESSQLLLVVVVDRNTLSRYHHVNDLSHLLVVVVVHINASFISFYFLNEERHFVENKRNWRVKI